MTDADFLAFLDRLLTANDEVEWREVECDLAAMPPSRERDSLLRAAIAARKRRARRN